ncbi:MAG: hypothetical protein WBD31_32720 [Rubripirellula sp.]
MQVLEPATAVLAKSVTPKGIITDRKKHRYDAVMQARMRNVEQALRVIEPSIRPPDLPSVQCAEDIEVNAQAWAAKIDQQLLGDEVGRVQLIPEGLLCTFFETNRSQGIMNNSFSKVRHVHKLARPHFRRWPYTGSVPKKGQQIIQSLCDAGLKRDIRIVTGDLIGEQTDEVRTWQERTALGTFVDGGVATTVATGSAIAAGTATAIAALGGMVAMFAADPCIVVGDICFWGWK